MTATEKEDTDGDSIYVVFCIFCPLLAGGGPIMALCMNLHP